ncbi:4'-phosphopantetheinyl transferase [Aquicoccus sp.]|uniref:4'-phosphopantetheinyl transferase family protein n=1 Tax=Aquicoccus sp. TaxID=2055851 RepID=UPI0035630B39
MALDSDPLAELATALERVLPPGVAMAVEDPAAPEGGLFAVEAEAMSRAVPARRTEFAAGRRAAHRAMARLGLAPAPVAMGPDRAPVWPRGLIGSISHCEGGCAALVARMADMQAVAVDLEPDADLPDDLLPVVCSPAERAWLRDLAPARTGRMARLIFSVKECVYKLQYPLTGKIMEFSDIEVEIDLSHQRFSARLAAHGTKHAPPWTLAGRFGQAGGVMFCLSFAR